MQKTKVFVYAQTMRYLALTTCLPPLPSFSLLTLTFTFFTFLSLHVESQREFSILPFNLKPPLNRSRFLSPLGPFLSQHSTSGVQPRRSLFLQLLIRPSAWVSSSIFGCVSTRTDMSVKSRARRSQAARLLSHHSLINSRLRPDSLRRLVYLLLRHPGHLPCCFLASQSSGGPLDRSHGREFWRWHETVLLSRLHQWTAPVTSLPRWHLRGKYR
jgi:hypothetical protein